jgi:hypothetical protein
MQWQDIVLTLGQFIFIVALIPALNHNHKPPFTTSVINTLVLFLYVVVYITLSLWFTALMTLGLGICWFVLAWQKKSKSNQS